MLISFKLTLMQISVLIFSVLEVDALDLDGIEGSFCDIRVCIYHHKIIGNELIPWQTSWGIPLV